MTPSVALPAGKLRRPDYDALRVLASFVVVSHHACFYVIYWKPDPSSFQWLLSEWIFALGHWSVPIFLMMSGGLLGAREADGFAFKPWAGRLVRIGLLTVVCSAVFLFLSIYVIRDYDRIGFGLAILGAQPFFHLWYLYMALGIYFLSPVLLWLALKPPRWIVYSGFVIVFAACSLINVPGASFALQPFAALGMCSYFMLGAIFQKFAPLQRWRRAIPVAIYLGAWIVAASLGAALTTHWGYAGFQYPTGFTHPLMAIMALCVFRLASSIPFQKQLAKLAGTTLGMFIVHPPMMLLLENLGFTAHWHGAAIGIPAATVVTYALTLTTILAAKFVYRAMRSGLAQPRQLEPA